MSMTPFSETLEGKLARIWSIRAEVLQVTQVIIVNIGRKEIVLSSRAMYLLFWYMFILKSPKIYDSFVSASSFSKIAIIISGKLLWLGGL